MKGKVALILFLLALALVACTTTYEESEEITSGSGPQAQATLAPERPGETEATADPVAVVESFYTEYLAIFGDRGSEEFENPLVSGAYRESPYLSRHFVDQIDTTLAEMDGRGGFDPILLAQDIPVRIETEEPEVNGDEAGVVLLRYWGGNPEPSPMVVHLRRENGRWLINNVTPVEAPETSSVVPQPLAPRADEAPEQVAQNYYDWYLETIGDRADGEFRNPLVEKDYRESPLLTADFINRVDALLGAENKAAYDPFLLAQDIPQGMMAQAPVISGDEARVTVIRIWGPPEMDAIFAHLKRVDGAWRIDDVTETALYEPTTATPEGTVQIFYQWHIDLVQQRFEDDSIDVDYHQSDLLTDGFKQHLDEMYAEAAAENPQMGLGYDPLLCAQDVPYHVTPEPALIDGETAVLAARTSFMNHVIAVDLRQTDDGWRISNVTCTFSPEGAAKAFYAWYLGYIGDRGDGEFRNPLADRAYRNHPLLSESFVQKVDGMFNEEGGIGHDPFLQAQDAPRAFSVDPGVVAGTAVVHFQFGPDFVHHVLATMEQQGSRWVITDIGKAEPLPSEAPAGDGEGAVAATDIMISSEYGFSLAYPEGWVIEMMDTDGAGPEDWPVAAGWYLMPADVAEQIAAQGAPDPNAPVLAPPFNIEVVAGDVAALNRVYPEISGEIVSYNGVPATVVAMDPGYTHIILQHPEDPELWLVVTDWVTQFPGREAQAEAALPALEPLLNSISFTTPGQ